MKFIRNTSIATIAAISMLAITPTALNAQSATTTTTATPTPSPTQSGCSGCIPTLTTTFFAGAAGTTRGNGAVQGGYLTRDANGNAQIVTGPGLTFTGKAQTEDYNHVVIQGGVNGKFCSTCVDTMLKIEGNVGQKSQANGMVTSNVAGQAVGVQSGTNAQVGFAGNFGIGGTSTPPTP